MESRGEESYGIVANMLNSDIIVSLNSSRIIMFTIGLILLRKEWTHLLPPYIDYIVPLLLFYKDGFGIE